MILIINSGSSSIKFSLFDTSSKNDECVASGLSERIGIDGRLSYSFNDKKFEFEEEFKNHNDAILFLLKKLQENEVIKDFNDIKVVGFRIVHGLDISEPSLIDEKVYETIKEGVKLAPLHNTGALYAIDCIKKILPGAKQLAYFDTGFHQSISKLNHFYPVDYEWYEKYQVKKYGFHGISYEYINSRFSEILNKSVNIIVCHLGNGASICSIKNGKSFDTTMGLTPMSGLIMGTRCGDVDPSIIEYMVRQLKTDAAGINDHLNKKSGLYGLSGGYSDLRDVVKMYEKNDEKAVFALNIYCQKIADFVIKMINQQNENIDGLVFTAGIGENSNLIRKLVCEKINLVNVEIDDSKNDAKYDDYLKISKDSSKVDVYKMRTNEEQMICNACKKYI